MNRSQSEALFNQASKVIPGGVNSPVRAFKAVGGHPVFIKSAKGAYLTDEDGNEYIDYINSWGPMILGHASEVVLKEVEKAIQLSFSYGAPTRREVEMAELICSIMPSIEMVRMVNSGTEATMSAVRLARGYTKRSKIIKFEGCYHGHGDSFLISAGSGALTFGAPDSPGVTQGVANDTLTVPYNDLLALEKIIKENQQEVAAIIIEPVVGNMGCVLPLEGYLKGVRQLCDDHGIVLIFDEVMTGFRLALGGVQSIYDVKPDLTTLGKIIGGGMPVGAYGGKKEIMQHVAPSGKVYQAGTLSGNPVAMAAGIAMLTHLKNNPEVYSQIENTTKTICAALEKLITAHQLPCSINRIGSMFTLFFTSEKVINFDTAKTSNTELFAQFFRGMLDKGIYIAPSQYESLFVSTAITPALIDKTIEAAQSTLLEIFKK
jgi:glutamate-1-semialdehyde 2,1-aminomutase